MNNSMNFRTCLLSTLFAAALFTIISCNSDDLDTPIIVNDTVLFTTNNSDGNITAFDFATAGQVNGTTFVTDATAADGVYYNEAREELVHVSRSDLKLAGYSGISLLDGTIEIELDFDLLGGTALEDPRELAVSGDFYVVSDSKDLDGIDSTAEGRFFIFERKDNGYDLRNVITTDFKVWGITFIGNDLYAVVDADNKLAVFSNFLSNTSNATVEASKTVSIEGIVRTHGITYDATSQTLVMTDIGSATNTNDDGGIHIIRNFTSIWTSTADGATISMANQTVIEGPSTKLGNPVDVAYDGERQIVYVAEAGFGGGRILGFGNIGPGGDMSPGLEIEMAGASSVYLHE